MDVGNECGDVLDRRCRQNPMAKIEDVTRASARALEDGVSFRDQHLAGSEKRQRVEIALNRDVGTQGVPATIQIDTPVEPHNVATRLQFLQKARRPPRAVPSE